MPPLWSLPLGAPSAGGKPSPSPTPHNRSHPWRKCKGRQLIFAKQKWYQSNSLGNGFTSKPHGFDTLLTAFEAHSHQHTSSAKDYENQSFIDIFLT